MQYSDPLILLVFLWAVLHDRPVSWACQERHWPQDLCPGTLPSQSTLSRRLRTRSGQVVLYQLTETGRGICSEVGIDPGPQRRESLEHRFWIRKAISFFENQGYELTREHPIPNDGAIDLLVRKVGQQIAIEIETGKSDIDANLAKLPAAGVDGIILIATSPAAVSACTSAIRRSASSKLHIPVQLMTWLDIS